MKKIIVSAIMLFILTIILSQIYFSFALDEMYITVSGTATDKNRKCTTR